MKYNEVINKIQQIIIDHQELLYYLADKDGCVSGVNEEENKELINFLEEHKQDDLGFLSIVYKLKKATD